MTQDFVHSEEENTEDKISDHPNILPRDAYEVEQGRGLLLR